MMKNIKTLFVQLLFLILFFPSIFLAQAPESMNYQAVIRNGSGDLVTSQQVGLRIKILQGSATGSSVYEETYLPTTNAYGLVNLQLGTGTVQSGTFSSIDWGNGPYFVETAADVTGGTSYVTLSTTQFMSVPYALYAKNAGLDSAAVQAMIDAAGSSGGSGGKSLSFPEGIHGVPVTHEFGLSNYTVPTGKRLYIYKTYSYSVMRIDGIPREGGVMPTIVSSGQVISSSTSGPYYFSGLLVNENPDLNTVMYDFNFNSYTVPTGKRLYILHFKNAIPLVDGNSRYLSDYHPLIFNAGQVISSSSGGGYFTGYLVDENYFESSSTGSGGSSSSSSGSNANTLIYTSDGF